MNLGELKPRGNRRLIYVSDPSNTTSHLSDPAQEDEFRNIIQNYTLGGVDTVVQEVFAECMTMFWRTNLVPYDIRPQHQTMVPMMDRGTMPVEVYIDECHKLGMEFIAGFRMNDRHGHHPEYFRQLCEEKPDWVLREYKPSWRGAPQESHEYGCSLNYAIEGVREFLLSIMAEVVSRFNVDGLELSYSRLLECFPADQAAENADIMTDFVRQARSILNLKDRNLLLGARIPQQMTGCLKWGLDIPTWIREGLVDYIAPGDFGFTDFNEKWEDLRQ
ncbi:MAG: family 10 glycosylhydrolase [Candidatus Latescibacterota bacterium]|nr:family 10 glycosylhydrolase [Candidatus Latescibacterota bacterium]